MKDNKRAAVTGSERSGVDILRDILTRKQTIPMVPIIREEESKRQEQDTLPSIWVAANTSTRRERREQERKNKKK